MVNELETTDGDGVTKTGDGQYQILNVMGTIDVTSDDPCRA